MEQSNGTEIGAVFNSFANSSLVLEFIVFSAKTNVVLPIVTPWHS